jgi:uncharacterized protein
MTETRSALYIGEVMHHRLRPFRHRFVYRVFALLLDLDELDDLDRRLRLLKVNRRGVLGLRNEDHGARDGSALLPWARARFAETGIELAGGKVRLLCFPRLWGYVFNPLSVYFGYGPDGCLRGLIYEVKNTFGGQHTYVMPAETDRAGRVAVHACDKDFHVSPFIPMEARYRFKVEDPGARLSLLIHESDREGPLLVASLTGERRPLDDRGLALAVLRHPLMTAKVIGAIHFEALRLWWKGAPFFRAPEESR